jgi:MFS family permease
LFGWMSDRIGRKPVMLAGYAIAALAMFPAFHALTWAANPALAQAQDKAPVVVHADPADCSFQFDLLGRNTFDKQSCDIARASLARAGISYGSAAVATGVPASVHVGERAVAVPDLRAADDAARKTAVAAFQDELRAVLAAAGYPASADPAAINRPVVIAIIALIVVLAAMTYAPIAALLVELFPARIRYTSLSLPYHMCAGWIGGLLPTTAFAIVAATGNIYSGLWYPVFFASLSLAAGLAFLPETYKRSIEH